MSSKVTFHLFGKPFIIFILGALFALIFGRIAATGSIIDVSPIIQYLSLIIFLLMSTTSLVWFIHSGYLYWGYHTGNGQACKHCGHIVSDFSHQCLHCDKHQWY